MKTVVIGAATSSTSSPAVGRRLRRAVSCRKEALKHRLEELVLELLAALVVIAIFMAVTAPETRQDAGAPSCRQSDRRLVLEDFTRPCRGCAALVKKYYRDLGHYWTKTQGNLDVATKSFRARSAILRTSTTH